MLRANRRWRNDGGGRDRVHAQLVSLDFEVRLCMSREIRGFATEHVVGNETDDDDVGDVSRRELFGSQYDLIEPEPRRAPVDHRRPEGALKNCRPSIRVRDVFAKGERVADRQRQRSLTRRVWVSIAACAVVANAHAKVGEWDVQRDPRPHHLTDRRLDDIGVFPHAQGTGRATHQ